MVTDTWAIKFDKNNLNRSDYGSITAPIYIESKGYEFPGVGWSDFVVVITGWWLESFSKLNKGYENMAEFQFMDGPKLIRLSAKANQLVEMQFITQGLDAEEIEHSISTPVSEIRDQLLNVSKNVLDSCEKNGWESDDLLLLKKEYSLLAE